MNYTATPVLIGGRRRLDPGVRTLGVLREDVRYTIPVPVRGFGRSAMAAVWTVELRLDVDAEADGCRRVGIDGRANLLAATVDGRDFKAAELTGGLGPSPPDGDRTLEAAFFVKACPSLLLRTMPLVLGVFGVDFEELRADACGKRNGLGTDVLVAGALCGGAWCDEFDEDDVVRARIPLPPGGGMPDGIRRTD